MHSRGARERLFGADMDFACFTYNITALKRLAADLLRSAGCIGAAESDISSFSKKAELTSAYPKRVPTDAYVPVKAINSLLTTEKEPFGEVCFAGGHINIVMANAFYERLIAFVNSSCRLPARPETTDRTADYALLRMLMFSARSRSDIPHCDAPYYRVLWALFTVINDEDISRGRKKVLLESACRVLLSINSTKSSISNEFASCAAVLIQAAVNKTEVEK